MKLKRIIKQLIIGCFVGVVLTFILKRNWKEEIKLTDYIWIIPFLLGLAIHELYSYYKYSKSLSKSIKKGIDIINNGYSWNTHYLIISKNKANENQILVTNDILWIEESNKKNYSEEILLKMLTSDFEKIAEKSKMKNFLQNRKVIFKLNEHR